MVIQRLSAEAQAKTGFTHVAYITFSDVAASGTINVQAV